jgi:hypothetical protein
VHKGKLRRIKNIRIADLQERRGEMKDGEEREIEDEEEGRWRRVEGEMEGMDER